MIIITNNYISTVPDPIDLPSLCVNCIACSQSDKQPPVTIIYTTVI